MTVWRIELYDLIIEAPDEDHAYRDALKIIKDGRVEICEAEEDEELTDMDPRDRSPADNAYLYREPMPLALIAPEAYGKLFSLNGRIGHFKANVDGKVDFVLGRGKWVWRDLRHWEIKEALDHPWGVDAEAPNEGGEIQ